jgi:hypothetical protein
MPKIIYPSHYDDTDKAIYDDLLSRGDVMVGKKLSENERFLLDLAAKMTINSLKGYDSGYTEQEIAQMKQMHKDMANAGTIETPPDSFYDDMIKLSNGIEFKHPLSYPAEYYYEQNKKGPDDPDAPDVIPEDDEDNYLVNQVDKMLGTD